MTNKIKSIISSGYIFISKFNIIEKDESLDVTMEVFWNDRYYKILFSNASCIKINHFNYPMEIYGFEIIDNAIRGWEKSSRYLIQDYEESKISLICEEVSLTD